jgi:glycosyltransferase involved in cell wall biosynthesis
MKTCEALAEKGVDLELVATTHTIDVKDDPYDYYAVKRNFKIIRLWCVDFARFGWLGFWVGLINFAFVSLLYVILKKGVFYTREEFIAFCLKVAGKRVIWEAHTGQRNIFARLLIKMHVPVVVISQGLKDFYIKLGVRGELIAVAHDGVDLERFAIEQNKIETRRKLGIDENKKVILYTGSRYAWKGVATLEQAAKILSDEIQTIIVTGKSYLEIPLYLKAADILILPNSAKDQVSKHFTSPMKLFEYMASNTPIIASDLPSIREILNDQNAYFVEPDNSQSLVDKVKYVLSHETEAQTKAQAALSKVKDYSWKKRSSAIIDVIEKISG